MFPPDGNFNILETDAVETRQPGLRRDPEVAILGLRHARHIVARQAIVRLPVTVKPWTTKTAGATRKGEKPLQQNESEALHRQVGHSMKINLPPFSGKIAVRALYDIILRLGDAFALFNLRRAPQNPMVDW